MTGKYKTVVIDFPWPVEPISQTLGKKMHSPLAKGLPYKTLAIDQIRDFPIDDFTDNEQCALFLWTTNGFVNTAIDIVKAWGFKYSRLITWDKREGINWLGFTLNSEFVIFAYRGKYPIIVKPGRSMPTAFYAKRGRHSEKPDSFYARLLRLTPEPRMDIFARKRHYGFDAWGDQVEAEPMTLEAYNA